MSIFIEAITGISLGVMLWGYLIHPASWWGKFCRSTYYALLPYLSRDASDNQLSINSLGMRFVPAGTLGILFSVWPVRVKDFEAFVIASRLENRKSKDEWNCTWDSPGFTQAPDHPVVGVSWYDAEHFCDWLTNKERQTGRLGPHQFYRLPSDQEWSTALGFKESDDLKPRDKDSNDKETYPWGKQWPPPQGIGNYADISYAKEHPNRDSIPGYIDGYAYTSPVGAFTSNCYGLFDLAGNVWELCHDWYNVTSYIDHIPFEGSKVLRGGAWDESDDSQLLSSARQTQSPDDRSPTVGFRCVIVTPSQVQARWYRSNNE